ncbi:MAG: aspartate aminotransferase family protein [Planctomycetota bacterium]|nr:aspartate aminotransferase family protein [Planctomycetota bacterium]
MQRRPDVSEGDVNATPARLSFQQRVLSDDARSLLDRDERHFLRQSLSTPCITALAGVRGSTLVDVQGREYLDFHGNSAHQVGHGHPRVVEAITRQLHDLPFCPRRYTNEPAVRLAEALAALTGGALPKVLLAPGGGAAMGIAMKLARVATGRFKFVSMWGAFHGAGLDTISIGGEGVFRRDAGPLLPGCEHVAPFAPSACALGCAGVCSLACAAQVEDVLAREGDVAAVFAEPVRCTTVEVPPAAYWQRIRAACDRHGALLVFDEIPTCLGRTGRMFAFEHFGVTPDILVMGKGLGGGIVPQAAVLARGALDAAPHGALGHYTHEKSPLGCAAALATLDVLRDEDLVSRSARAGEAWRASLRERLAPTGLLREVRGVGLLVGVELRVPAGGSTVELCDRVLYACLERGLNFKVSDGRVLTLTPPLTVTDDELARATEIIRASLLEAR